MNRVAASLAREDTDSCLRELDRLAPRIGLAEVRLDLMRTFDISKLVANSPVPLILTCRPEREGGGFTGPESERAGILRTAWESGCAYIDVEADSLDLVSGWGCGNTFHGNDANVGAGGYGFSISSSNNNCGSDPNRVFSDNTVENAGSGFADIPLS